MALGQSVQWVGYDREDKHGTRSVSSVGWLSVSSVGWL